MKNNLINTGGSARVHLIWFNWQAAISYFSTGNVDGTLPAAIDSVSGYLYGNQCFLINSHQDNFTLFKIRYNKTEDKIYKFIRKL